MGAVAVDQDSPSAVSVARPGGRSAGLIKSISDDQHEILRNIQTLFAPNGFDVDPTYSKGVFYAPGSGVTPPRFKFDKHPQTSDTVQALAHALPLPDASVGSLVFDPPFIVGHTTGHSTGKIGDRFSGDVGFGRINELWDWYALCLREFYRVLRPKGIVVFKCQDTVNNGKNRWSHVRILNEAQRAGFVGEDLFILQATVRMIAHNQTVDGQKHARKWHSYFWVLQKGQSKGDVLA